VAGIGPSVVQAETRSAVTGNKVRMP
jgi:hypothetical protein